MSEVRASEPPGAEELVLTFRQPWATLIAIGAKQYEVAALPPEPSFIGRRVAIRAAVHCPPAKGQLSEDVETAMEKTLRQAGIDDLSHGTIVGTAVLRAAWHTSTGLTRQRSVYLDREIAGATLPMPQRIALSPQEILFGTFAADRWLWRFEDAGLGGEWHEGKVKWLNHHLGFGFIRTPDAQQDVFLHLKTLKAAGIADLQPDEPHNDPLLGGRTYRPHRGGQPCLRHGQSPARTRRLAAKIPTKTPQWRLRNDDETP